MPRAPAPRYHSWLRSEVAESLQSARDRFERDRATLFDDCRFGSMYLRQWVRLTEGLSNRPALSHVGFHFFESTSLGLQELAYLQLGRLLDSHRDSVSIFKFINFVEHIRSSSPTPPLLTYGGWSKNIADSSTPWRMKSRRCGTYETLGTPIATGLQRPRTSLLLAFNWVRCGSYSRPSRLFSTTIHPSSGLCRDSARFAQ